MQQKYIAIGVAVVVVLAAVAGGVALVANQNDDNDNGHKVPEIIGKWNLAYVETAILYSALDDKPITDASKVEIGERHLNPYEDAAYLEITKKGDHSFRGKLSDEKVNDIYGTLNGPVMKFVVDRNEVLIFFEAVAHVEGYVSCTMTVTKAPTSEDDHSIIYAVGYMLFIRDGEKPVPIRSDYFDMSIMKAGNYIKSTLHKLSDFTEGERTGKGKELGVGLEFSHAHNMISVFSAMRDVDDPASAVGAQVVVSMGATPDGTVVGCTAGNLLLDTAGVNSTFVGNMTIAHGKAAFVHHVHQAATQGPEYIEIEYNVPYYKGGEFTPVYLSQEHQYDGTVTVWTDDKESKTEAISKKFVVYDNTFYCETVKEGKKIVWFGEIYGHIIDVYILGEKNREMGHITGHVDHDLNIHLFGVMHSTSTGNNSFLEIHLKLTL